MRYPLYTDAEISVMRKHFPTGGAKACHALMPDRSLESIRRQARIFKIKTAQSEPRISERAIIDEWLRGTSVVMVARKLGAARSQVAAVVKGYNRGHDRHAPSMVGLPPKEWSPTL